MVFRASARVRLSPSVSEANPSELILSRILSTSLLRSEESEMFTR